MATLSALSWPRPSGVGPVGQFLYCPHTGESWLLPMGVRTQAPPRHLSQQTTSVSISLRTPDSTQMLSLEKADGAWDDLKPPAQTKARQG